MSLVRHALREVPIPVSLPEHSLPSGAALSRSTPVVQSLAMRAREVLRALASAAELRTAARKPLTRRSATKAPEIKLLNPRFEEEYAAGEPGFCPSPERLLPLVITSHAVGDYKCALAYSHPASIMHESVSAQCHGVTWAAGVQARTTTRTGSAARPSGCGGSCRRSAAGPCASCARTPPSSAR